MLVSQDVVVFFNKDVIIMKPGGGGGCGSMTACDFPGYLQQIPGNLKS